MLERTIFKHLNVYGVGVPPLRVHIAGVFVMGCRVAKVSHDFRIPNTEVKDPHCRRVRCKSQCGERLIRLSFQGQEYLGRRPLGT
ncbi:hypothetical protein [Desulfosporosinus sp. Sb-LF]|uniref:hypothetical protein n=1 Tax=Desulfosporosinus sp. Sb-LF TaxID=2560027 RepID=UPI00107FC47D|nr:hypothetical protein [Desulfosporosinus sp. Sb-LF]TGE32248.1 hypothetical protein E4K68_11590 [Desulfosporosinus sp. Sb-LF]